MILLRHGQSAFNVVFGETRQDPGIVDPELTELGHEQAKAAAEELTARDIGRILVSPYQRTLQTASYIAERLGLPLEIEPLVRERAYFVCDVGSPRSVLQSRFPAVDFAELPERWWPERESVPQLIRRCRTFHKRMSSYDDWRRVIVVTHWGFVKGMTGLDLANGEMLTHELV